MALKIKIDVIPPWENIPDSLATSPPAVQPTPAATPPSNLRIGVAQQASSGAIKIGKTLPPAPPPSDKWGIAKIPGGEYSIIDALNELLAGRKGTLMLVSRKTGEGYKVDGIRDQNPDGIQVTLLGKNGMSFRPRVGMREVPQYTPVWR